MKGKALFEVFMAFQGYLRVEEVLQVFVIQYLSSL